MLKHLVIATALSLAAPAVAQSIDGLATVESKNSPAATIEKFEAAAKQAGLRVFTRIDHAAAASEAGLTMPPATVVIFGSPAAGTPNFLKAPTLAIDLPMRALVWQDAAGKTFVSYNSGAYLIGTVLKRHGLNPPAEAGAAQEKLLAGLAQQAAN